MKSIGQLLLISWPVEKHDRRFHQRRAMIWWIRYKFTTFNIEAPELSCSIALLATKTVQEIELPTMKEPAVIDGMKGSALREARENSWRLRQL